jgi:hypothetical protein
LTIAIFIPLDQIPELSTKNLIRTEEVIHPENEVFDVQDVLRIEAEQLQEVFVCITLFEELLGMIEER